MTFGKYYVAIECHVSDVRLSGQLCRYLRHVEKLVFGLFSSAWSAKCILVSFEECDVLRVGSLRRTRYLIE